jgi:MYXO-CTERM domain-containing protein
VNRLVLAAALVCSSAALAHADGWVDCNGPDKQGHGCSASRDGATTGGALLVVGAVAYGLGRRRRRPHREEAPDGEPRH